MTSQPTPNDPLAPLYAQMAEYRYRLNRPLDDLNEHIEPNRGTQWRCNPHGQIRPLGNVTHVTESGKLLDISTHNMEFEREYNLPLGSLERVVRGLR